MIEALHSAFAREVQGAEPGPFLAAVLIGGLLSLLLCGWAFHRLGRIRLIENLPTSRVRSAAQGFVELEGQARPLPGEPVLAPLTRKPCCWWRYRIEEKRQRRVGNQTRTEWVTIDSGHSDALFRLCDTTGDCIVDPVDAEVIPSQCDTWYGRTRGWSGPPATGWSSRLFARYRYREERVALGDDLYALGWFASQTAETSPDRAAQLREGLAELKRDPRRLAALDRNGDGLVDAEEWDQARQTLERQLREQAVSQSVDPDLHVLRKPPDRRPFLLSTRAQAELVRQGRWAAAAALAGALLAAGLVLAALRLRGLL
ncbi:MAG TPA: GIDE domain-containing protein [Nevskiaceae bacterium]|nr:GIDE domain-containing protein [Nevskiaceae bacterium]